MCKTRLVQTIQDQTRRSLESLRVVLDALPDTYWNKPYCGMPVWKHVYHTLHSLDQWYINPLRYEEPPFHTPGLNSLDEHSETTLSRARLDAYFASVRQKIEAYLVGLTDARLAELPEGNDTHTRLTYILAQHRHLDMHIGMLMGFLIAGEGLWPDVLGLND